MKRKGQADFYPTPTWAAERILQKETLPEGLIWEPACGDGAISKVINALGYNNVYSSDLYDRGYGDQRDFLESTDIRPDCIITNPPYNLATAFVNHALSLAQNKVIMLLRLAFLEGQIRGKTLFKETPPHRVWVHSARVTMYPNGIVTAGGSKTAHAWFVWEVQNKSKRTELGWL